ncbi:MAG: restriction endonuclease subunit S, partial [Nitrosomonadales bacterium]|nr:restriction endonuclease subunit S [Nitrosomonadales bacterium]
YLLHNGDFAYNKSYSKGYPMGAIKCLNRYSKGVVSTLYICFKLNDGNINAFFEHYFEAGLQNSEIEKVAQEGARNHGLLNIGLDDFFSINLTIPSTREQEKIATFLTAIDDKLTHTQNQLAAANQYKQGLLQQMFA